MTVRTVRALVVALVAGGCLVAAPVSPTHATTGKTVLQYFLSPHPDDVFMGWSLVQDSATNYPVFITLTKGESTAYCTGDDATPLTVQYWGTFDRATPEGCKGARMASLNNWLDDQSDADPFLDDYVRAEQPGLGSNMVKSVEIAPAGGTDDGAPSRNGLTSCRPAWGGGGCTGANPNAGAAVPDNLNPGGGTVVAQQVTWYVGTTSARVELDLGDGNLTDAEVVWALEYVRDNRASKLPLTEEYGVIAAAYANVAHAYSACTDYSHHDHRAVHEAVYNTDLIPDSGNHPQWGATCGSRTKTTGVDPEALPANGGRANRISNAHYAENMSGPSAYFQRRFGWLHGDSPWPSSPDPMIATVFAQWNYFWRRFG